MLPSIRRRLTKGVFIVIDGIDGSGKTTQARLLAERYIAQGFTVTQTKEPTNGPWGLKIREIAQHGREGVSPEYELELFLKDRDEDVSNTILPALEKKHIVIADRYYYSTIAYQGAIGIEPKYLQKINQERFPRPDLAILLDVPPEKGISRILKGRKEKNNKGFEQETYLRLVRKIFRTLTSDPVVREVDGTSAISVVFENIIKLTDNLIKGFQEPDNGVSVSVKTNPEALAAK